MRLAYIAGMALALLLLASCDMLHLPAKKTAATPLDTILSAKANHMPDNVLPSIKKINNIPVVSVASAREQWEIEQAEKIEQEEASDHKACTKKGLSLGKMENPNTEAYYDCRAVLATKHASPPPPGTKYSAKQPPKAALKFYRRAEEAKHAFNERDYQDHYACLDQNLFPGPWEEPNTADYYRCRASLAENSLGKDIQALFLEDVARAKQSAEEHHACTLRGLQKGSQEYALCRKAYAAYQSCKEGINAKLSSKDGRDHSDCTQKAKLEYPTRLAKKNVQHITNISEDGEKTKIKSVEAGRFTPKELHAVRASSASMCMGSKAIDRKQYRLQLEYQCEQLMQ